MERLEPWILPSRRQMIAKCIEDLVDSHRIETTRTDDDMLWCEVDMRRDPDSVLAVLGIMILSWGPPVLKEEADHGTIYLFNPLVGRARDSIN